MNWYCYCLTCSLKSFAAVVGSVEPWAAAFVVATAGGAAGDDDGY